MSFINSIVRDTIREVDENIYNVFLQENCLSDDVSVMYIDYHDRLYENPVKVFGIIDAFMFKYLHPDAKNDDYAFIFSNFDNLPIPIKKVIKNNVTYYLKKMMIKLLTTYHGLHDETKFKKTKLIHLVAFEYFYRNKVEEELAEFETKNPKAYLIVMELKNVSKGLGFM